MPPVLILNGPVDGAAPETADRVAVSGTASDVSGIVAVTVGGMPVALTAAGGFSVAVAVGVGTNPIVVTALDGAGNLQMLTRTITRVVPVIPIRAP
ncbi:unnamed protein product, partial [Phaeothamnion confervicola]